MSLGPARLDEKAMAGFGLRASANPTDPRAIDIPASAMVNAARRIVPPGRELCELPKVRG
jgi:hypothetical protein